MSIKDLLNKVFSEKPRKGLSPSETELNSFLERDRMDKVKALLHQFKLKQNKELLFGNTLVTGGKGILESKNVMNGRMNLFDEDNSILRSSQTIKEKGILDIPNVFI